MMKFGTMRQELFEEAVAVPPYGKRTGAALCQVT
jgi:hypothetical protein